MLLKALRSEDDKEYLSRYPDVAEAVRHGEFGDGWHHFCLAGRFEGRIYGKAEGTQLTRACFDPWHYLEVSPTLGVRPCCKKEPIADWNAQSTTLEELRNSEPFQKLRAELLTGNLDADCQNCSIRPQISVEHFKASFQKWRPWWQNWLPRDSEPTTDALPLHALRLDITTQCNLRCVYCAVSQDSYRGVEMPTSTFDDILALIRSQPGPIVVHVNGHGETTYHKDWLKICQPLVDAGVRAEITTNLAKSLSPEESNCFAHFATVQVSLDTVNPPLLAELRRKVQLRTIVENIEKIRAAAAEKKIEAPTFTISCGIYDANYTGLEDLARFCVSMGIRGVTFWQLAKYDDIPNARNVYPIPSLEPAHILDAIGHTERALGILQAGGISAVAAGEFLNEWRAVARDKAAE